MEVPKIHLSSAETELMQNAEIILTKNRVLTKIRDLLETLARKQYAYAQEHADPAFAVPPKIAKGENYLGLPYLVLDFPRISMGPDLFFIRTMFWWGHFFSSTLHLEGRFREEYAPRIQTSQASLDHLYISIGSDPWTHHFDASNYRLIGTMSPTEFEQSCVREKHLKIAARWPLSGWSEASSFLYDQWEFMLALCGLVA